MIGNISKSKGFKGDDGAIGPAGPQGEKGDSPAIVLRLDDTGNLYYSSDGILIDKEYADSHNYVLKSDLDSFASKDYVTDLIKTEAIPTITKDEVDTLLPTGIYRYEEEHGMSIIIVKHTEYSNYQAKITSSGICYQRDHAFLDGEWQMTSYWTETTVNESRLAWKAIQATQAEEDNMGNHIASTYAKKAEVIEDAPLDGKDYVRRNGEWIDAASGGDGGIKTLSSDEVDTILPTGVYKYDDGETMSIIIVKHTDYDNYQAKIDTDGRIYCRVNPFLYGEGEWGIDNWQEKKPSEAEKALRADEAEKAMCDADGKIIHLTYATKDEVGNIETALDNIIAIQNSLIGGDSV